MYVALLYTPLKGVVLGFFSLNNGGEALQITGHRLLQLVLSMVFEFALIQEKVFTAYSQITDLEKFIWVSNRVGKRKLPPVMRMIAPTIPVMAPS